MESKQNNTSVFDKKYEPETEEQVTAVKGAFKVLGYDKIPIEILTQIFSCTAAQGIKKEIYVKIEQHISNFKEVFKSNKRFHQTIKGVALSLAIEQNAQKEIAKAIKALNATTQVNTDPEVLKAMQEEARQFQDVLDKQFTVLNAIAANTDDLKERIDTRKKINSLIMYADDLQESIECIEKKLECMSERLDEIDATTKRIEEKLDRLVDNTEEKFDTLSDVIEVLKTSDSEHDKKIAAVLERCDKKMTKTYAQILKHVDIMMNNKLRTSTDRIFDILGKLDKDVRHMKKQMN